MTLTMPQRHLQSHIEPGHLTQNKYDLVKLLMKKYNCKDARKAEELWIDAYMEVFDIGPQDRHLVPSPCMSLLPPAITSTVVWDVLMTHRADYDSAELASNPSFSAFGRRLMDRIRENPATAIPLMNYIAEDETLNRARNVNTERLRDSFRAQEARLIEENHAEREAAIRELDDQYDEMQRRLYRVLESALDPSQQLEGGNQPPPQQGVGTIPRNTGNPSYLSRSTSTNEGRIFASHLVSDQPSGFLTPTTAALPVSPESNSNPGPFRGPTANDSLYDNFFFIGPQSMTEYDVENEAFFDIAARQRLASTPAANTHHVNIDTDFLHTRANDTIEASEAALPWVNIASDVPSAQFGSSPHSGYGNSYARCGACDKICHPGQELCESCADVFDNEPFV
jgi:hypothetical protein